MDKIKWCLKKGMRVVEPSEELSQAYLWKARMALKEMIKAEGEWKVAAAYYARYFSIYAVLIRVGVKTEIHSCSLEMMKLLGFSDDEVKELTNAKDSRERSQYYVINKEELDEHLKITHGAFEFYERCKTMVQDIDEDKIIRIRKLITYNDD